MGKNDPFGTCTGGCTNFQTETLWNQMMESVGLGCKCSGFHPYCRDGDCYKSEACTGGENPCKNQNMCKGKCAPAWTKAGAYDGKGWVGSVQDVCAHGCAC